MISFSPPTTLHHKHSAQPPVIVSGRDLSIDDVVRVAVQGAPVQLSDDPAIVARIERSCAYINQAVTNGQPIYGVTSGFGGMAHIAISPENAAELQNNLIWYHKTGTGKQLPREHVRAAMLLRMNSHMRGASGIRLEIIERMATFLNANVTPHVLEYGSIGASGDLVPLTYITGALIGQDAAFTVDFQGEELDSLSALERLGLQPLSLLPKEGLAMINGTSVMAGIAALVVAQAQTLLALSLGANALFVQALRGTNQSFHPFIHALKPHPGQVWAAEQLLALLDGSQLARDELDGRHDYRDDDLIQDRYSLRCMPQYLGPIVEGIAQIARQITVEINSVSDNPLIDADAQASYHGGNFLGQYVGMGMDHLRYYLGLLCKHLDVQIALLVTPEFNNGLPGSLRGNAGRQVNMGLKGLQLTANSLMPLLTFFGNSLADRFPTHAEQFNQNVNSQGFGSANLARQSIDMFQRYMAIALMFGVQAVDLRAHRSGGSYDPRGQLSAATLALYSAVREVIGQAPSAERPYVWNDHEQVLDAHIAALAHDIAHNQHLSDALKPLIDSIAHFGCATA